MRSKKLALLALFLLLPGYLVLAHGGETAQSLDEVLKDILQKQGVKEVSQLRCEDISEEDFERLGEAVMSYMHPDPQEHEAMDNMMGGEGSESLRSAHIHMGKRFLGCEEELGFRGDMGMGMMMPWFMMGRIFPWGAQVTSPLGLSPWIWQTVNVALFVLIVGGAVLFLVWLAKKIMK